MRDDWERTRVQTFHLMRVQMTEKDQKKYTTPKSIMPFEWDIKEVQQIAPQPTEEEFKRMDKITAGGKR